MYTVTDCLSLFISLCKKCLDCIPLLSQPATVAVCDWVKINRQNSSDVFQRHLIPWHRFTVAKEEFKQMSRLVCEG